MAGPGFWVMSLWVALLFCLFLAPRHVAKAQPSPPFDNRYSGYFPVNATLGCNMFYWYFPARNQDLKAPLILWLEGGPGIPGTYAVFSGMGPYRLKVEDQPSFHLTVTTNPYSWNQNYSLLFVDNPVGVGYSYCNNVQGIPTDQKGVAANLWTAMQQFYSKFPSLASNDLYIWGHSYGGKYAPSFVNFIMNHRCAEGEIPLPLKGMAIANGLVDPIIQAKTWAQYGHLNALLSKQAINYFEGKVAEVIAMIQKGDYANSSALYYDLVVASTSTSDCMQAAAGGCNPYDTRRFDGPPLESMLWATYLAQADVRKWLHVYPHEFIPTADVLTEDITKSTLSLIGPILDSGLNVLVYTGQFEWLITVRGTRDWIEQTNWKELSGYNSGNSTFWRVNKQFLFGTLPVTVALGKIFKNFVEMNIVDSGHYSDWDQPEVMQLISNAWIQGTLVNPILEMK